MNLQDLKFNRFLIKTEKSSSAIEENTTEQMSADVYNPKNSNNSDSTQAKQNNDATNVLTGTVITSCFIRTSDLAARVELSGNDMRLYDDSKGGGGSITGDTSKISFIRADKNPGDFILQKRHGKDYDLDNVMEMFYLPGISGRYNYFYLGREGSAPNTSNLNYAEIMVNSETAKDINPANGSAGFRISRDHSQYPASGLLIFDALTTTSGANGAVVYAVGEGADGGAILGWANGSGVLTNYIAIDNTGIHTSPSIGGVKAGKITAAGAAGTPFPSGWTVSRVATGTYEVVHNLGTTNYSVVATAANTSQLNCVVGISSNNFQILVEDTITGTDTDAIVCFMFSQ